MHKYNVCKAVFFDFSLWLDLASMSLSRFKGHRAARFEG